MINTQARSHKWVLMMFIMFIFTSMTCIIKFLAVMILIYKNIYTTLIYINFITIFFEFPTFFRTVYAQFY